MAPLFVVRCDDGPASRFDFERRLWDNTHMVGERQFLEFAADVLGVAPGGLSLETTYGSISEWDSMAHLRLVMDLKSRYGVEIPFAEVTNVTSLWEFFRRANRLSPKKVVAVDLDGTLWDGVAGEDGPESLRPNVALQTKLKDLKSRGVLLVALSKNNFEDVRGLVEAFGDFVAWRINWRSKAENLADVAAELNIGVDSFVFVDDNPAERLEMAARLPEVSVAAFPPNLDAYFPPCALTDEDRAKTEEYRAEAKRREWSKSVGDLSGIDIWKELGAWVDVHELRPEEAPRVAQLSQKANQFSVCTNRYGVDEVRGWIGGDSRIFTVRAGDRFGEQGLVAFARLAPTADGALEVLDWTMSCRVAGRGLEERAWVMIADAIGACRVRATWRRTAKNAPVADLFERLGFSVVAAEEGEKRYEQVLG